MMYTECQGPSGLAWLEAGTGPPVLFLHGLGGSATAWSPQFEALEGSFRCLAWDLPGYGRSPLTALGEQPMSFPAIADAVVTLLDEAEVAQAAVVGLSFGGQQALHLALDHPSRVSKLVLANSSAAFGGDGTDPGQWLRLRLDPLDRGLEPYDMAPGIIDAIAGPMLRGPRRQEVVEAFGRISSDGFRAAVLCLPNHDVANRLGSIAAETLIIVGELDGETPPSYSQTMADRIPDTRLEILAGVGHLSPSEDPDNFNRLLIEFLTSASA